MLGGEVMKAKRKMFSHAEVVECLLKKEGIHSGLWGLAVSFGFGAANVSSADTPEHYLPAAIVPIAEIGIQEFEKPSNLTVDAAKVNPSKPAKSTRKRTK